MKNLLSRFIEDNAGATSIEYGLIATLIATIILAAFPILGPALNTVFTSLVAGFQIN